MPLNFRYRHHALMGVLQVVTCFLGRHGSRLQQQYARDDLQAVGNAVLYLSEAEHLFDEATLGLPQKIVPSSLRGSPFSDIDKGKEDRRPRKYCRR